jgi:diguanylate cyclase (GGDEF)-like protein/PAS domain S-box-containing protein/putative nucleotidyltransferase with HDIG domain
MDEQMIDNSREPKGTNDTLSRTGDIYHDLLSNAGVGLFRSQASDGKLLECNEQFAHILGYETIGECLANYSASDLHLDPGTHEQVLASAKTTSTSNIDVCITGRNGAVIWVRLSARFNQEEDCVDGVVVDITKDKRAAEALGDTERRYRLFTENLRDILCSLDMDLRFTSVSPSVEHVLGYTVEEALPMTIDQYLTPASVEVALQALSEELEIEKVGSVDLQRSRTMELELIHKDGSIIWSEVKFSFLRDDNSQPIGILGVARDVTERKRAEEAARFKEEYYRRLIENAPDGFVVLGADGKLLLSSPSADRILGYDSGELVGVPVLGVAHPDDMAQVMDTFNRLLLNAGATESIEVRARHKDGSWCHIEVTATNHIQDPAVAGVVINLRDITERKQAEEAVRFKEQYYRRLIENAPDGFVVLNADGSLLLTSSSAERILGYTHQEMQGVSVFGMIHPDDVATATDIFSRLLLNPGTTESSELRCHHKDGSWRHIETKATNYVQDPAVGGVVINLRDITERKQAQERLEVMATKDYVTGLWNHREFHARLAAEVARAQRANQNVSLLFLDIDNFKSVNAVFGHRRGDEILSIVGQFLREAARVSDIAARYGGDEFTVVLPDTDANQAYSLATRIQRGFKDLQHIEEKLQSLVPSLNLSIGIATYPDHASESEQLVSRANQAMFYAKSLGGNRSAIWNTIEEFDDHTERLHHLPGHGSLNMAMAMATAVDARDPYTIGHSHRVGDLAFHIAMELNLNEADAQTIRIAGLLHDVGKIAIPDRLLKKRRGLTKRERESIKGHVALGATMLKGMEFTKDSIDAVAGHHENWDGTGYPWGIAHEDIALGSRIIRLADTFDAMTTEKRYGKRIDREQALREIEGLSGKWFDPTVISALKAIISKQIAQGATESESPFSVTPSS